MYTLLIYHWNRRKSQLVPLVLKQNTRWSQWCRTATWDPAILTACWADWFCFHLKCFAFQAGWWQHTVSTFLLLPFSCCLLLSISSRRSSWNSLLPFLVRDLAVSLSIPWIYVSFYVLCAKALENWRKSVYFSGLWMRFGVRFLLLP